MRWMLLLLSLVAAAACGGTGPDRALTCSMGSKCGGYLEGTWKLGEVCPVDISCQRYQYTGHPNATYTFRSDNTFRFDSGGDLPLKLTGTGMCATAEACQSMDDVTCVFADGVCTCMVTYSYETSSQEGTYTIEGSRVSIDFGGGEGYTADYCALKDTLYIGSYFNTYGFEIYKRQ